MAPQVYPTAAAQRALAARLNLPYSEGMQDWEWEVADASRFSEFVRVYERDALDVEERVSLMEIIVQCADDLAEGSEGAEAWAAVERLILAFTELHWPTVKYWACLERSDGFAISPNMRSLWKAISRGRDDA